jgi:hypothetical protein
MKRDNYPVIVVLFTLSFIIILLAFISYFGSNGFNLKFPSITGAAVSGEFSIVEKGITSYSLFDWLNNIFSFDEDKIDNVLLAPVPTSVSGNLIHGEILTISGSGFGVKIGPRGDATPLFFDDFEINPLTGQVPTEGVLIPKDGNWNLTTPEMWTTGFVANPYYSSTNVPPGSVGRFASLHLLGSGGNGEANLNWRTHEFMDKNVFISFWTWFEWADVPTQIKLWRIENYIPSDGGIKWANYHHEDVDSHYYQRNGVGCPGSSYGTSLHPDDGAWYQVKFQADQSSPNVADGSVEIWHSHTNGTGAPMVKVNDVHNVITTCVPEGWDNVMIGETCTGTICTATTHFDDVYIDNTWQRIELCDNETWNNRRKCEMQIPQTWQDNSIKFTANQGTFTNGTTAWIYVIDENGNVSSGYPITISGEAQPSQCNLTSAYWEY